MRMNRQYGAGLKNLRTSLYQSAAGDPATGGRRPPNGANAGDAYVENGYTIYPH